MNAVYNVARFVEDPGMEHWQAVKRVLRYLQGRQYEGIRFEQLNKCELRGYCDADWAGDEDSRKSTTGFIFFINNSPVSWSSKRQASVALSTVEAEYIAATTAAQEATHLRNILHDMGEAQTTPTIVKSDNQGSIALAKNPTHHSRTKHIDIRAHFIREQIEHQVIALEYVETHNNAADILTKPLDRLKFNQHKTTVLGQAEGASAITRKRSEPDSEDDQQ